MSGAQLTAQATRLVRVERRRGLEGVLRELVLHVRRLQPAADQRVEQEEVRRRVLREHDGLAAQVGHRLDASARHTMPSPPFDQSICW